MSAHFTSDTFRFLRDLSENNSREWFGDNKGRYESDVREPALQFIVDFGPRLSEISPHFRADPRKVGGSLFRIHRDVRFSKDKSPYKTSVGIQFRHARGKDVHTPGFYLHLEPGQCFVGCGIWRPDRTALRAIRDSIVENPAAWLAARDHPSFAGTFELAGDSLKRGPRDFDHDHPLIDDIKRKDFIGSTDLAEDQVTGPDFLDRFETLCRHSMPLQRFLCAAVDVPV